MQIVDPAEKRLEVIVEDTQLSLAIGKKGQNVRLAAKLTGWRIDIKSEEEKRREIEVQLEGLSIGTASTDEPSAEESPAALEGAAESTVDGESGSSDAVESPASEEPVESAPVASEAVAEPEER